MQFAFCNRHPWPQIQPAGFQCRLNRNGAHAYHRGWCVFVHVQWADTVYVLPAVCVCQSLLSAGFSVSASMKIESSHQCLLNFITWPVLIYTTHKSVCARVCVRELWSGVDYANRNPAVGPHAGAPCVCVFAVLMLLSSGCARSWQKPHSTHPNYTPGVWCAAARAVWQAHTWAIFPPALISNHSGSGNEKFT